MTNFPVTAGDTGLTITSTTVSTVNRAKTDTGLTITSTIARRPTRSITDTGLTVTSTVLAGRKFASTGLTITDSITRHFLLHYAMSDTGINTVLDNVNKTVLAVPLPVDTTLIYKWTIKVFNFDGSAPTNVDYSSYSFNTTSNTAFHASQRNINFYLNGVDDCSFTLYLDDPMAAEIIPTKTMIKVYRTVYSGDGVTVVYADESTYPCFAGTVASTVKDGAANTMQVQCYSPFWRLQTRFHVRNHYLKTDSDTGLAYTGSGIIFKVISLLELAFPATGDAYTGITQGSALWYGEPHVAPYFIAKGTNSWSIVNDDIMARPASPDLIPIYIDDGSNLAMILDTDQKRGYDRHTSIFFNYHTGTNDNCDNITEEFSANPGEFANFLWVIGQGGPNSGKVALAWDNGSADFGSDAVSLYMKTVDKTSIKRVPFLQNIADEELAQSRIPKDALTVTLSPYGGLVYNYHYGIGDVVQLVADKGALQINAKQRIYQVGLAISDDNVEIASPLVSKDFTGKVSPDG